MDLPFDLERNPMHELGRPRAGRHHHRVEAVDQIGDRSDRCVANHSGRLREHRRHSGFWVEDARLLVEHRHLVVPRNVSLIPSAQLVGAEQLDVKAMRAGGFHRAGHRFGVRRADHQSTGHGQQLGACL